jgi:hypothetical protein
MGTIEYNSVDARNILNEFRPSFKEELHLKTRKRVCCGGGRRRGPRCRGMEEKRPKVQMYGGTRDGSPKILSLHL